MRDRGRGLFAPRSTTRPRRSVSTPTGWKPSSSGERRITGSANGITRSLTWTLSSAAIPAGAGTGLSARLRISESATKILALSDVNRAIEI